MKLIILESKNPYLNLAIEEYLFKNATEDIFMIWQNEPTIVIGKNQNAFAEINLTYVKENNIHVARRITGGGAVYHDLGNVNYTYISKHNIENKIDFQKFTQPIVDFLKSYNIPAKLSGRNDILVNDKKISGNAQHNFNNTVLHHGTILFDTDLSVLSDALNVDEEKIKSKAIRSTRSRVENLKSYFDTRISTNEFIRLLSKFIAKNYSANLISLPYNQEIESLFLRNSSDEWIFPNKSFVSDYEILKKQKYDFGLINICLNMINTKISVIKINGDFFGTSDISELEELLTGINLNEIGKKLESVYIHNYIYGMTNKEFIELITK